MDMLMQDVRYALRMMQRNKGFSAAALLTLALGIGACTAVFSLVYGVLLRPLPYPDAGRLVRLSERHPGATSPLRAPLLSNLTYYALGQSPRTVEGIAAYSTDRYTVTGLGEAIRLKGASVSPILFPTLRARPALGRFFVEDDASESPAAVVLSDGFWKQHFGADPAVIGRSMIVERRALTIIGVTPPEFYFPDHETRFWTPRAVPRPEVAGGISVSVFPALARLRPGASTEQAEAEATAASRGAGPRPLVADMLFGSGGPVEVRVRALADEMAAPVRPALMVLAIGVGLLMLIACTNVANLFLSRGLARQRELAVRAAVGAGQGRLVRQLATESLVLSVAGGALGMGLGMTLVRVLPAIAPASFPRLVDVRIDPGLLGFAAIVTLASGLLSGLAPALRGARSATSPSMHTESRYSEGGFKGGRASRARGFLLVAEAAVATMLLIGAGLLIRSFGRLLAVDPGYDPSNVVAARAYLPDTAKAEQTRQFADSLLERLRRTPGVLAAGAANMAPLAGVTAIAGFQMPAEGDLPPKTVKALQYIVTPGYPEALSLRLKEGRFFTEQDRTSGIQAVMVNQEFVRQYLSRGPVAGRRFLGLLTHRDKITEVIGVVGDVLKDGFDARPQPEMYLLWQGERSLVASFNLVVRTSGDASPMASAIRSIVKETDRSAALDEVATLAQKVSASVSQPRFVTAVLSAFAALALLLAAIGLYGVLSYNVTQRRRELGVRAALGATPSGLVALVVREGIVLVGAGLVVGIAGAALLTRLMTTLLFGVSALDVMAFAAAPATLLAVALAACAAPARRAASADPAEALRCE